MTPKVDTFEHDIADEIKRKEASLAQINAAQQVKGPEEEIVIKKPFPVYLVIIGILFVGSLAGLVYLTYFYFTDSLLPPSQAPVPVTANEVPKVTTSLSSLSFTLHEQIGPYITSVEKQDSGYILTINAYGPVFSYMVRNEKEYIEELLRAVSPMNATTTTVTTSPVTATSTTSGTSTNATTTSTSTLTSTSSQVAETTSSSSYFKDVTLENQNMRVWVDGSQTVVYAFLSTNKVLISNSTEGILKLRSAILK